MEKYPPYCSNFVHAETNRQAQERIEKELRDMGSVKEPAGSARVHVEVRVAGERPRFGVAVRADASVTLAALARMALEDAGLVIENSRGECSEQGCECHDGAK